ncbi:flagellar basal body rod protein FlgG [Lachnospiraceae bacterium]|uniref:flagellar hook-basal body protein n=1 Tax=Extibacter sp. GGCC_0201 TaxID=2731209 RepID=UPI001AA1137F|nr:flagellar hook-basal body complex protein [Extibacter sp. GGCC_0201]MBO1719900.1 flagellar hook-basal body complex protein [Extibacter sp. GGCC_0201]BDF35675.1 flagellar basal body rod protein FlgG [Lachnospiraceae bacterium]BDF39677.1 flagellar basal body rod protein FlgG [Lachnospiraceae bacterium]
MFQGFYNLTSSVLTQTRRLNVISNNMSNVSTPGFKSDQFIAKTFKEEMIYRSGNKDKSNPTQLGTMNRIVTADRNYTDFASGGYASTDSPLDFALNSSGFFCIQSGNGTVYTRNGSFSLDDGGYLCLQGVGRVLGQNGPIYLGTDKIVSDSLGNLYTENGNTFLGRLSIVDFQNYDANLTKGTGDVFTANGQGTAVNGSVVQKALESSNVEPVDEMARMMASERSLQSSAQVLKMYDQLIGKAVTQLGPV